MSAPTQVFAQTTQNATIQMVPITASVTRDFPKLQMATVKVKDPFKQTSKQNISF